MRKYVHSSSLLLSCIGMSEQPKVMDLFGLPGSFYKKNKKLFQSGKLGMCTTS